MIAIDKGRRAYVSPCAIPLAPLPVDVHASLVSQHSACPFTRFIPSSQ